MKSNFEWFTLVLQLDSEHLHPDSTAQVLLHPSPPVTRSDLVLRWTALVQKRTRLVHSLSMARRTSLVRFWTRAVQIQTRSVLVTDEAVLELLKLDGVALEGQRPSCKTNVYGILSKLYWFFGMWKLLNLQNTLFQKLLSFWAMILILILIQSLSTNWIRSKLI